MINQRATTFARVGGAIMIVVGLGCAALGLDVSLHGAEAPPPAGPDAVEGTLLPGPLTPSPVGQPFLFGEVRVADQPGPNAPHHRGNYGDPHVRIRVAGGEEVAVELNSPEEWRLDAADREDTREVPSLANLPVIGELDTERRLNPPFYVRVRALRPGDSVLLEAQGGVALRTYVGERATHEALHGQRESMRWPMVALLMVLGLVSVFGGARLLRARVQTVAPGDEVVD